MNFGEPVALLHELLDAREDIVEQLDRGLLSARGGAGLPRELSQLHERLAAAHVADGFEPTALEGSAQNFDPLALAARAHQHWERSHRPGRNVRLPFADRLYSVFIFRQLEHLCLRIWDDGNDAAPDRLREIQALLDRLNAPANGDPLVRDARWLIQTAQGPLTRRLEPYFRIAGRISASFTNAQRLEIHKAGAVLTGGHLRSQLRHRAAEMDRPTGDPDVLATTRNSNSMDAALLLRDLVPLLEAYAAAGPDTDARLNLADAIFQGMSADPELFLTRLDLLAPCTMIEHLFIGIGEQGQPRYTALGETHRQFLESYAALVGRHAAALMEDARRLDPPGSAYSPSGIVYGFCADILSNMALDTLLSRSVFGLSLEDMFDSRTGLEKKRARADGWKTRHDRQGARNAVDYSADWAAQIFGRTMSALASRAAHQSRLNASDVPDARLFVESAPEGTPLAQEHCVTSDLQRALATGATAFPKGQIVSDRNEGRFLASAEADGKWFGISKVVLTVYTSLGKDALITGIPASVVEALPLTCPGLAVIDVPVIAEQSRIP